MEEKKNPQGEKPSSVQAENAAEATAPTQHEHSEDAAPPPLPNIETAKADDNEIGIKANAPDVDQDVNNQNALATSFQLNDKLKAEIKALLKEDLNSSVTNLIIDVKKEGQEVKKDFLTIFGLFASFVTFLSIEVQVFKNKDNIFELLGISSISLAFVMFFALIINDIAKDKSQWSDFKKPTYIMNLIFIIIGVLFLFGGGCSATSKVNALEKKVISDSLRIVSLKQQLSSANNSSAVTNSVAGDTVKKQETLPNTQKTKPKN